MNIGIIGSRRRNTPQDKSQVELALLDLFIEQANNVFTIVSGGCPKGGDRFAEELAALYKIPAIIHYPDKSLLPPNPQRWHFAEINYARNSLIARDSDILIALVADDRKGGTEDTIKHFLYTWRKPKECLILLRTPGLVEEGFGL